MADRSRRAPLPRQRQLEPDQFDSLLPAAQPVEGARLEGAPGRPDRGHDRAKPQAVLVDPGKHLLGPALGQGELELAAKPEVTRLRPRPGSSEPQRVRRAVQVAAFHLDQRRNATG